MKFAWLEEHLLHPRSSAARRCAQTAALRDDAARLGVQSTSRCSSANDHRALRQRVDVVRQAQALQRLDPARRRSREVAPGARPPDPSLETVRITIRPSVSSPAAGRGSCARRTGRRPRRPPSRPGFSSTTACTVVAASSSDPGRIVRVGEKHYQGRGRAPPWPRASPQRSSVQIRRAPARRRTATPERPRQHAVHHEGRFRRQAPADPLETGHGRDQDLDQLVGAVAQQQPGRLRHAVRRHASCPARPRLPWASRVAIQLRLAQRRQPGLLQLAPATGAGSPSRSSLISPVASAT